MQDLRCLRIQRFQVPERQRSKGFVRFELIYMMWEACRDDEIIEGYITG